MSRNLTKAQAVTMIQEGLGFRNTSTGIEEALRWAQDQLETGQTLPWFLRQEDEALVGTLNVGYIALPTGFLREDEEADWWVTVGSDTPVRVLKRSWSEVKQHRYRFADTDEVDEGTPLIYALRNSRIEVSPVPTEAWAMTVTYFKAQDDLSGVTTNAWLENAPDLLWSMAGIFMAKKLRDVEGQASALEFFQPIFTAAEKLLKNEIALREDSNREYSMGRLV